MQLPREPGDGCDDPKVWSGHDAQLWPDPVGREFPGLWPIQQCGRMAMLASHTGPGHRTHLHLHQHAPGTDLHRGGGVPSCHGAAGDLWQCGSDCWTIAGWDALSIRRLSIALHRQCRFAPAFRCCLFDLPALQGGVEGDQGAQGLEAGGCGWSLLGGFRRLHVQRNHCDDLFCCHAASATAEWHLHPGPGGLGCFRTTAGGAFCGRPRPLGPHRHRPPDVAVGCTQHLRSPRSGQPLAVLQSQLADGTGPGDLWPGNIFHWQLGTLVPLDLSDWWSAVDRFGLGSLLDPRAAQHGGRRHGPAAGHPSGRGAPRGVASCVVHLQRLSGPGGGRRTLDWHLVAARELPAGAQGHCDLLGDLCCLYLLEWFTQT
mmetsp:Transcript_41060/g.64922  ORF Transcript_41060/g.64922 Transcript_41060/m.64922 type:complete len:372 (+) Transcript_41060:212-1327(+)